MLTAAQQHLVTEHLYLAEIAAKKTRRMPIPYEDRYSSACMGLVRAAEKFDPSRGVPFGAYAYRACKGEIIDEVRNALGRHGTRIVPQYMNVKDGTPGADVRYRGKSPAKAAEESEDFTRLVHALPKQQRFLLSCLYVSDMDMLAAAGAAGISETWAHRSRNAAFKLIRERFAKEHGCAVD